jgi:hypothetical protein
MALSDRALERVDDVLEHMLTILPSFQEQAAEVRRDLASKRCVRCAVNRHMRKAVIAFAEECAKAGVDPEPESFKFSPVDRKILKDHLRRKERASRRGEQQQKEVSMDGKTIQEELNTGKAKITWAVFPFLNDPKLIKVQKDADIADFVDNLTDEDPYKLVEQPRIAGIKQYLVLARDMQLPFMEEGLQEQHKEDLMASGLLRSQLEVYKKEFPWTREFIDDALKRADAADCTSCEEKKILRRVVELAKQAGELPTVEEPPTEDPEETTSARPPCADCTRKHISQAIVLINESHQGYPAHRWLAVGHLAEASDESMGKWPSVARKLREERIKLMEDPMYIPDLMQFLEMDYDD